MAGEGSSGASVTEAVNLDHRRERRDDRFDSRARGELAELLGGRAFPDVAWLRQVTGQDGVKLRAAILEAMGLVPLERSIYRMLARSGRTYYAQFPAPLDLYVITRLLRPRHVVESGVSSGVSTAHILAALAKNGRGQLHSMDRPQYQKGAQRRRGELSWSIPPAKDSGWAVPRRLRVRWDLRKGTSEELLPTLLDEVPAVDLFCHDSPWTAKHLAFEFTAIRPKLRSGSIVVADNSDVNPEAPKSLALAYGTRVWHRRNSSLIGIRIP